MTPAQQKIDLYYNIARRLFYTCLIGLFVTALVFAVYYFTTGYETLTKWFLSFNDCFYRNTFWTRDFFTPEAKTKGNYFAAAASVVCIAGLVYAGINWKRFFLRKSEPLPIPKLSLPWSVAVAVLGLVTWYLGQSLVKPSSDEIFSAVNCSELPHFQVLAYYMLPNNHIYFNFINGFVMRWTHTDAVVTGRIISMVAYIGVLFCIFHWLSGLFKSRLWAFVAIVPAALQFTPWAFGFQSRGYECQLLCAWGAFLTLYSYVNTGNARIMKLNALFSIMGFAFVPTFLYFFLTQLATLVFVQVYNRKLTWRVWKYQSIILAGVFLLYLPALCFSGVNALTANDYVKSPHLPFAKYFNNWVEVTKYFINFIFSFVIRENHPLNFILFFTPLLLLILPGKHQKQTGVFYLLLWVVWACVCFYMQRNPFSRNMIFHYSLTFAFVLYTIHSIVELVLTRIKSLQLKVALKTAIFAAPLLLFSVHLAKWGKENVPFSLYFMDVNVMYNDYASDIKTFPPGCSIACSNERYCFYYYCRTGPYRTSRCPTGNEDYFINVGGEQVPDVVSKNYVLERHGIGGFEIYKHK